MKLRPQRSSRQTGGKVKTIEGEGSLLQNHFMFNAKTEKDTNGDGLSLKRTEWLLGQHGFAEFARLFADAGQILAEDAHEVQVVLGQTGQIG